MMGTPFCMLPVTSLNGIPIGTGEVGSAFTKILRQWSETVDVDIKAQIQAWSDACETSNAPTPYQFKTVQNMYDSAESRNRAEHLYRWKLYKLTKRYPVNVDRLEI